MLFRFDFLGPGILIDAQVVPGPTEVDSYVAISFTLAVVLKIVVGMKQE